MRQSPLSRCVSALSLAVVCIPQLAAAVSSIDEVHRFRCQDATSSLEGTVTSTGAGWRISAQGSILRQWGEFRDGHYTSHEVETPLVVDAVAGNRRERGAPTLRDEGYEWEYLDLAGTVAFSQGPQSTLTHFGFVGGQGRDFSVALDFKSVEGFVMGRVPAYPFAGEGNVGFFGCRLDR